MGLRLAALSALFASAAAVLAGNGALGTLLGIRAGLEDGFSTVAIGIMGSAYFVGCLASAWGAPAIIRRSGHVRTFATLMGLAGAATLIHAMVVSPWAWILLRMICGFAFTGLTLVIESWVNEKVSNQDRGRVLSVYRIVDLSAVTLGQVLVGLMDPLGFQVFSVICLVFCLGLSPILLSRGAVPKPIDPPRLSLGRLFRLSPMAVMGALVVGMVNGTFRQVGPTWAQAVGMETAQVATFMALAIIGGAVLQWPLGAMSDRIDRRLVLMLCSVGAMAAGVLMILAPADDFWLLYGAGFLFGGFSLPVYSLSVAHANDYAEPGSFVEIGAGLVVIYSVAAIIGPTVAAWGIATFGPWALFAYTCGVHALLVVFGVLRILVKEAPARSAKRRFVGLLRTSANIFRMDPRARP